MPNNFQIQQLKKETPNLDLKITRIRTQTLKNKNKSGFYPHRVVKTVVLKYLNGSVMKTNIL